MPDPILFFSIIVSCLSDLTIELVSKQGPINVVSAADDLKKQEKMLSFGRR